MADCRHSTRLQRFVFSLWSEGEFMYITRRWVLWDRAVIQFNASNRGLAKILRCVHERLFFLQWSFFLLVTHQSFFFARSRSTIYPRTNIASRFLLGFVRLKARKVFIVHPSSTVKIRSEEREWFLILRSWKKYLYLWKIRESLNSKFFTLQLMPRIIGKNLSPFFFPYSISSK